MKPIPKQVQRAIDNGDLREVSKRISAAYLLYSMANVQIEEANEILFRNGLRTNEIKMYANKLDFFFDKFNGAFQKLIETKDNQDAFNDDFFALQETIEKFIKTI